MQKAFIGAVVGLAASLAFSSMALAQTNAPAAKDPWRYYPTDVPTGDGGPAPKRDLSGTWNGPGSSTGVPRGGRGEAPVLTPVAQQIMSARKSAASSTLDSAAGYCDPPGYPANLTKEGRALQIATMPDRIVILYQYQQTYRVIWTDGRSLPKNVGTDDRNALDPTYEGYAVGHWEDDYNFVVQTTGLDENISGGGVPHSVNAIITERWTRIDHNNMKLTVTVDDPKMVTKPYSMGTFNYKWNPNQMLPEMLCIPSNAVKYATELADPAGATVTGALKNGADAGGQGTRVPRAGAGGRGGNPQ